MVISESLGAGIARAMRIGNSCGSRRRVNAAHFHGTGEIDLEKPRRTGCVPAYGLAPGRLDEQSVMTIQIKGVAGMPEPDTGRERQDQSRFPGDHGFWGSCARAA